MDDIKLSRQEKREIENAVEGIEKVYVSEKERQAEMKELQALLLLEKYKLRFEILLYVLGVSIAFNLYMIL